MSIKQSIGSALISLFSPAAAFAAENALSAAVPIEAVNPIWLIALAALAAMLPILVGLLTSYLKISIVFGMVRSALGTQQTPGNLVIMVLALALTSYTMMPVADETLEIASQTDISALQSPSPQTLKTLTPVFEPWRRFLHHHSGARELRTLTALLAAQAGQEQQLPAGAGPQIQAIDLRVLLPAFLLTELKESFAMAFVLLLPFLVVDMVVANILIGMGMYMVSPLMISLPLKLVLFVVADGWLLIARGLINSYQG